jgi:predicted phage terminase large subunit-like protein
MEYPELKRAVRESAVTFKATTILIEDKSSGAQLIQELIREGLHGVTRYDPQPDKIMRLHSVTSTIENGFVHLPEKAEWLPEYLHEMTCFRKGKFDDQCDSTSQALDWVKSGCTSDGFIQWAKQEAMKANFGSANDNRIEHCPRCQTKSVSGPLRRCSKCGREEGPRTPSFPGYGRM